MFFSIHDKLILSPKDQKYMTAARTTPSRNRTGERRIYSAPRATSTYHYPSVWDASTDTSHPLAACDSQIPSRTWDCVKGQTKKRYAFDATWKEFAWQAISTKTSAVKRARLLTSPSI
jgi:hypothetical protein